MMRKEMRVSEIQITQEFEETGVKRKREEDGDEDEALPCHDVFFERRPPRARDLSECGWFAGQNRC